MKKLILFLVLSVLLNFNSNADDIKDFEIEGISIGDSLLKYFSKKDVKKSIAANQGYHDKSFVRGVICDTPNKGSWCNVKMDMNTYDAIQFHFKKKDSEYVLFMLSGILEFPDRRARRHRRISSRRFVFVQNVPAEGGLSQKGYC